MKLKTDKKRGIEGKDWKVLYDEDTMQRNFTQHIAAVSQRPDVVI